MNNYNPLPQAGQAPGAAPQPAAVPAASVAPAGVYVQSSKPVVQVAPAGVYVQNTQPVQPAAVPQVQAQPQYPQYAAAPQFVPNPDVVQPNVLPQAAQQVVAVPVTQNVYAQPSMIVVAEATPKEKFKDIRSAIRTDMGRHGGVLLLGQLVTAGVLLLVLFSGFLFGDIDGSDLLASLTETTFIALLAQAIGSLVGNTALFIPFAKKRGVKPFRVFPGGEKPKNGAFWRCALVGLGFNFAWGFIYQFLSGLFPAIEGSSPGLEVPAFDIPSLIVYCILVCVIAPVTEEFMFRGVLLHSLRRYGDRFAIVVTAILFGLLHGNLAQTPMAFLLGLVLGYVAVKTGNIWYSIAIHFINNSFVTILSLAEMYLPQYEEYLYYVEEVLGVVFILAAIAILIIRRKHIAFPKDSEEVKNGLIRHRYLNFFSSAWNVVLVVMFLLGILSFLFPTEELLSEVSQDAGVILSRFFC